MGAENEFSKRVRAALRKAGCAIYPVETGGTAKGFPDLVVLHEGGPSLVELKCRPNTLLSRLGSAKLEGPGQGAFARVMARKCCVAAGAVRITARSFLLVECMDGVALMVEEESGAYLAACWEGLPSGGDLRDALRAWRISVMPSEEMSGNTVADCWLECSRKYGATTGIAVSLAGLDGEGLGMELGDAGGKRKALEISRDICDRGRYALLMESMEGNNKEGYCAPIEGGNGFVILGKGD